VKYYDIVSPYGYGGIYVSEAASQDPDFIRDFSDAFNIYCVKNNIVSEFIRFHPLQKNYVFFKDSYLLKHVNNNVYVDLRQADCDILKNIAKRHRYCIRKAIANGVKINFEDDFDKIESFIQLYEATNDKNNATAFYYFGKEFFSKLRDTFGNKIRLVTAYLGNRLISASLFIFDEKNVYYFLSGTNKLGYDVFACHLLLHEAIFRAKKEGRELFNLGGGLKSNDSLFLFKSGFSSSVAPYYIGTAIRMPDIYEKMLDASGVNPSVDYFPKYRYKS
jgi:serine/alanine adding enzyme